MLPAKIVLAKSRGGFTIRDDVPDELRYGVFRQPKQKILIVLASHDQLGETGKRQVSGWKSSP